MTSPAPHNPTHTTGEAAMVVERSIARLNARAWGIAFALVGGLGLLGATWILVLEGGTVVGPHLSLLANFFPGYSVTFVGGMIGFVYGFVGGYGIGRLIGVVYNRLLD